MGDSGEGLIDNEGRIQERIEELQHNRAKTREGRSGNPELLRQIESLDLARKEMMRSLATTAHEARKKQITAALAEIERRIQELQARNK